MSRESACGSDDRPDFPSYRTIGFPNIKELRAALGRRVFRAGNLEETVDYSHRTTAEYLAAAWLAKKVQAGFPIRRVRALIGIGGCPASELRGIHAWLPVFLPEYADLLIEADPFGVLTYGDAASLEPSRRKLLLEALARLATVGPWFRTNNWSARGLGALAGTDMVEPFKAVLRSDPPNFNLRSVVFDALANGVCLPELEPDLIKVLSDESLPYLERVDAAQALAKSSEPGKQATIQQYYNLRRTGNAIRLRANILAILYGEFDSAETAELLLDTLGCEDDLPVGSLSSLPNRIPLSAIPPVLDRLEMRFAREGPDRSWRNTFEVFYTFDRLLLRVLKEFPGEIRVDKLRAWLGFRLAMNRFEEIGLTVEIKEELSRRSE
jgi:hypothetical protein